MWLMGSPRKEKKCADLGLSFFRFPKDPVIQAAWVHRCARQDFIYTKTASVCSLHFTVEDYDPSYLVKRNLMPNVKPRLKPDAILSQNIPSHPTSKEEARAERCEQRKTAKEVAEALAVTCDPSPEQQSCTPQSVDAASTETQLRLQVRMLRKKLAQQATTHRRQREAWRRERVLLRREVRTLQVKAKACVHPAAAVMPYAQRSGTALCGARLLSTSNQRFTVLLDLYDRSAPPCCGPG